MKNILLIGNSHPSSIEVMFYNGFKSLNKKVFLFDPGKNFREKFKFRFLSVVLNVFYFFLFYKILTIEIFKKKYDLIILFKGAYVDESFLNFLKKKFVKSFIININTDNPFYDSNLQNRRIIRSIKFYDYYFTWSKSIQKKIIFSKFLKPQKVKYLPFGYDDKYRKKEYLLKRKINKVLFYGSWDMQREKILKELDNINIDIYGNAWDKASPGFKKKFNIFYKDIFGSVLAKKVAQYKLCINLHRPQVENSHNMRFFEVTGYGGILLTPFTKEQNNFFNEGDVFYYKNIPDLKKKLLTVKNNKFYFNIKKKVFKKSLENSYKSRCKYILKCLKN